MVLSVDVRSGEAALFSIPRNMVNVPLPKESRGAFSCKCFPQMINALYVYASGHPRAFPGSDEVRGLRAVQMAIGELVGRKLDGMVVVNLQGFVKLINAIGGLDINVPEAVYDHKYPLANGSGYVVVSIPKGKQHMNGKTALMYARSRHMDSDYGRMERQQIVISALAKQLLKEPLIVRLPELLEIAKDNLWTNIKTRDLPELAELAEDVDIKGMKKVRFIPPKYPSYLNKAAIKRIRAVVRDVFDDASPLATPTPLPTIDPSER
jgi:LCP family protein required for cell wall assembly